MAVACNTRDVYVNCKWCNFVNCNQRIRNTDCVECVSFFYSYRVC